MVVFHKYEYMYENNEEYTPLLFPTPLPPRGGTQFIFHSNPSLDDFRIILLKFVGIDVYALCVGHFPTNIRNTHPSVEFLS